MKPAALSKAIEIIAACFILLFIYTATSKLLSYETFVINIKKSPLIGFASSFLGWTIPVTEIVIAVLLFVPRYRRTGLFFSFGLMAVFTTYIAYMLIISSQLPCSCGGIISKLSWRQHLWINVFLTLVAAIAIYFNNRLKSLFE